jgi:hypothetical protein
MADNVELDAGTGGATVAADDIAGVHHQRVKLQVGADGEAADVDGGQQAMADSIPVVLASDHSDVKVTLDSEAVVLGAGSAAVGKLAANSGVDIGDVDVTSVPTDPFGANADAASATGSISAKLRRLATDLAAIVAGSEAQVDVVGALPAGTNNIGKVNVATSPTGGAKMFSSVDLDETEEDIATGPCTVYAMYFWNATAAPLWVQLFNTNTVTVGTTAPTHNFPIPANADSDVAGVVIPLPVQGIAFDTALTVAVTTGVGTDDGAPGANHAGCFIVYQD